MIYFIDSPEQRESIARSVLEALPDWFGLPDSTAAYVRESREQPFWAELTEDGSPLGFLALKETSPDTAELAVMGVLPQCHRQGVGRKLFDAFYQYAKEHGYSFLQVKTVQEGRYEEYDRTAAFYQAIGFKKLECFPTLWDAWNPCQIYVMAIS